MNYRDLIVWQKAMDLAEEVYKLVKLLPKEERYVLSDQLRRAVVSVASNIAEETGRVSAKDTVRFWAIAQGSRAETETQLLLCVRFGYLTEIQIRKAMSISDEIGRILAALIKNKAD